MNDPIEVSAHILPLSEEEEDQLEAEQAEFERMRTLEMSVLGA